jgi:hypothetical protein
VNTKNQRTLSALGRDVSGLRAFEDRLAIEYRRLEETITPVCAWLLPFGFLSHFWRMIRSWLTGSYFKREELSTIHQIESAVEQFLSAFS